MISCQDKLSGLRTQNLAKIKKSKNANNSTPTQDLFVLREQYGKGPWRKLPKGKTLIYSYLQLSPNKRFVKYQKQILSLIPQPSVMTSHIHCRQCLFSSRHGASTGSRKKSRPSDMEGNRKATQTSSRGQYMSPHSKKDITLRTVKEPSTCLHTSKFFMMLSNADF